MNYFFILKRVANFAAEIDFSRDVPYLLHLIQLLNYTILTQALYNVTKSEVKEKRISTYSFKFNLLFESSIVISFTK